MELSKIGTATMQHCRMTSDDRISGYVRSGTLAMPRIKEGTDYKFHQTHHTGNRRGGHGPCRSAALVCSADSERRSFDV